MSCVDSMNTRNIVAQSDIVLTLQSSVAAGHVGNAGAAFALQRLGRDVIRIDTVRFSNHPKHGGYAGGSTEAAEIDALAEGLEKRGFLQNVCAVLSGYLGTDDNADAVARAVDRVRALRPDALFCLDPVIGDKPHGSFVAPGVAERIAEALLPRADIIIPNIFELEHLTGSEVKTAEDAVKAARTLMQERRVRLVVATGLHLGTDIANVAVSNEDAWICVAPTVDAPAYGAGDLFAAVYLGRYLETQSSRQALELATSAVHAVFVETAQRGLPELALIPAQAVLAAPPHLFVARAINHGR